MIGVNALTKLKKLLPRRLKDKLSSQINDWIIHKRFQDNIKFFNSYNKDLLIAIPSYYELKKKIEWFGSNANNIYIKDKVKLYPAAVDLLCEKQINDFVDKDFSQYYGVLSDTNITDLGLKFLQNTRIAYQENNLLFPDNQPKPLNFFGPIFVFGLGLGKHIEVLLTKKNNSFGLVIIEPVMYFFWLSFLSISWRKIFKIAKKQKQYINFMVNYNNDIPIYSIKHIINLYRLHLDGSSFFSHYYSWLLETTYHEWKKIFFSEKMHMGFYEDELIMFRNSIINVNSRCNILEQYQSLSRSAKIPVFIVGAGPSVDNDIDNIIKLKDKAIIVSCGTALSVLLNNNIKPDFHLELENVKYSADILTEYSKQFDYSDITLLASTTVHPDTAALFTNKIFFFRSGNTFSGFFYEQRLDLSVGMTVTSAAVKIMLVLGFKKFYLFGVDCGYIEQSKHHSSHSYYANYLDAEVTKVTDYNMENDTTYSLPGNFGGIVQSKTIFKKNKEFIESIANKSFFTGINCSNGAKIQGFQPMRSSSVVLDSLLMDKEQIMASVKQDVGKFEPNDFNRKYLCTNYDKHYFNACMDDLVVQLKQFNNYNNSFRITNYNFSTYILEIINKIKKQPETKVLFLNISDASIISCLMIMSFVNNRTKVATIAEQKIIINIGINNFIKSINTICDDLNINLIPLLQTQH